MIVTLTVRSEEVIYNTKHILEAVVNTLDRFESMNYLEALGYMKSIYSNAINSPSSKRKSFHMIRAYEALTLLDLDDMITEALVSQS